MLRRVRETAPVGLVPLAWGVVAAAHLEAVSTRALFVAHVVMSLLLSAFAALSWADMAAGALRTWRTIIAVGCAVTLAGTAGFLVGEGLAAAALWRVSLYSWLVMPGVGLLDTGRRGADPPWAYRLAGDVTLLGAATVAVGDAVSYGRLLLIGLLLVGLGQTAGIVTAALKGDTGDV